MANLQHRQSVHRMARRSRSRLSRRKLASKRQGRGFGKMHEFVPVVAGKNVICSVCKHLMAWKAKSGPNGMITYFKNKHPTLYKAVTEVDTTTAAAKVKVAQGGRRATRRDQVFSSRVSEA
ncbi:unnamed protein product [Pylaiella littoralis]